MPGTRAPLGRVNQLLPTGEEFVAPPSILPLVRISQALYAQSGGLFNPATGYLNDLWGFRADGRKVQKPPSPREIRQLVDAAPAMTDVHVDGLMMRGTNPAIKLDFSAITKGYGIDLAIDHLRERGVRHAMVSAGGTVRVIGERSGQPWRVTVRRPSGTGVLAVLQLRGDESLATVADYGHSFVYEGRTYHHVLDPRTGYPATGAHSVTVIHNDAADRRRGRSGPVHRRARSLGRPSPAHGRALRPDRRRRRDHHPGSRHGQTRRVPGQGARGAPEPAAGSAHRGRVKGQMTAATGNAGHGLLGWFCAGPDSNCPLGLTLGVALVFHLLVILGVRIEAPTPGQRKVSTVEVVVVRQAQSSQALPDKISAAAQVTQGGSGEGRRDATTRQQEVHGPPGPSTH